MLKLRAHAESWPLSRPFVISRGRRTEAEVIVATLEGEGSVGRGEATPYSRYRETPESVRAELNDASSRLRAGESLERVLEGMRPGAARNALDCAGWDLRCKQAGVPIHKMLGWPPLKPLVTAYTISLGAPEAMEAVARENAHRPILKIKTGGEAVVESVAAVRRGAPESRLVVDANEAWPEEKTRALLESMAELGVAFIEQPLPAGRDALLAEIRRPLPVFADESFHAAADLAACLGKYDGVNLKLDKTGGLTGALRALEAAREAGLRAMCGCMLGTSLAAAPAMVLAQRVDFVDIDAPLLLASDRPGGIHYRGSVMMPFGPELWG